MKRTINNSLVIKPWGNEYLFYQNEHLAIWALDIKHNQKTSFHSHLKKNTGLIVLDGIAKVSFLNNSINLKGLDKIQIFARRFHSTQALSKNGCKILEIESPVDKLDLVRMTDEYNRADKPYETEENYKKIPNGCLTIPNNAEAFYGKVNGCFIEIFKPNKKYFKNADFEEIIIFLKGGLKTKKNKKVVEPGDVVSSHNVEALIKHFDLCSDTVIMSITNDNRH